MQEFKEEGIDKITEALEDDLQEFLDRLEEMKDAGESYKSFGGEAENGSVKFIIETAGIE